MAPSTQQILIHWPVKFFNQTQQLYKINNNNDKNLKIIGELICTNELSVNYLVVSIIDPTVNKINILNGDKYFVIGEINTKKKKFKYTSQNENIDNTSYDVQIIEFVSPRLPNMQFFSDTPIYDKLFNSSSQKIETTNFNDQYKNLNKLIKFMDIDHMQKNPDYLKKNYNLNAVINCLNISDHHLKVFNTKYPDLQSAQPIGSLKNNFLFKPIFQFINMSIIPYFFIITRILFREIFLNLFLKPLYWLRSYSISFSQLDLRIKQFSYFPIQYLDIGERTVLEIDSNNAKLYGSYMDYIRYYNTIWLIVNDYSFALTFCSLLQVHKETIIKYLSHYLEKYLIDEVISLTNFLTQNPYGIKLNDELSKFLKDLFLWIIEFVNMCYFRFLVDKQSLSFLIDGLSLLTYCFGMTFAIAVIIDYTSILTLHFKLFYKISSKLYSWQLKLLISLFYLFCGKKYNTLRNRVDSENYSLEVLLIGVLIFMILIFLLPTIISFYLIYTCLQYMTTLLEIGLMTVLMCLNNFPLFIIMLKLKDGDRIPGGVHLSIKYEKTIQEQVVVLKGESLKWQQIFTNFLVILVQFRNEIFSVSLIKKCIFGNDIIIDKYSFYKPLYSNVPNSTIKLKDFTYKILHENPRKYS